MFGILQAMFPKLTHLKDVTFICGCLQTMSPKIINLKDINKLPNKQKNKVNVDLKNIKKKRTFKKLNLSNKKS